MNKKEAKLKGLHKYWPTGVCRKGHESLRYTSSGLCVACVAGYARKYKRRNGSGLRTVTVRADWDDVRKITEYAEALRQARGLTKLIK